MRFITAFRALPLLLLLALPAAVQAQFTYVLNNDDTITIGRYTGPGGAVTIPATINGLPVTSIADQAFYDCTSLTSVTIPNSVTSIGTSTFADCTSLTSVMIPNSVTSIGEMAFYECYSLATVTIPNSVSYIGDYAFYWCTSLTNMYFQGNAPSVEDQDTGLVLSVFGNDNYLTVYYLPGTTGWGPTFVGRPALLWNPEADNVGVRANRFGFTITGTSNLVVVVEASTSLQYPKWVPVGTNTLTGGSSYFSDPRWTNIPARFYRFRSP